MAEVLEDMTKASRDRVEKYRKAVDSDDEDEDSDANEPTTPLRRIGSSETGYSYFRQPGRRISFRAPSTIVCSCMRNRSRRKTISPSPNTSPDISIGGSSDLRIKWKLVRQ